MSNEGLVDALNRAFVDLEISEDQRQSLELYLGIVKQHDFSTYNHSIRVGLKGIDVAEFTHVVHPKALFYPGLLHDVGKALVDSESLTKVEGFNEADMAKMRRHPSDGYRLLQGVHDFSAEVILRHHIFSNKGYPKKLPVSNIDFSMGSGVAVLYCARLLGLVDFYDAMMSRGNDKFSPGTPRLPTREEGKGIIIQANPDQKYFLEELFDNEVF